MLSILSVSGNPVFKGDFIKGSVGLGLGTDTMSATGDRLMAVIKGTWQALSSWDDGDSHGEVHLDRALWDAGEVGGDLGFLLPLHLGGGDLPDHCRKAGDLLTVSQPHKNEDYPVLGLPN